MRINDKILGKIKKITYQMEFQKTLFNGLCN